MRFSTVVGKDGKQPTSARQWHITEFSVPSSPSGERTLIPIWEKEHSTNTRTRDVMPEDTRTITPKIHSPVLKSDPLRVGPQMSRTRLPLRNPSPGSPNTTLTKNRFSREMHRKSLSQRFLGLFMALCIAIGLLGCIMDRLAGELNKIDSELEKRNEMMLAREQSDARLFPHSLANPSERRARRLAATGVEALTGRRFTGHDGFFDDLKFQIETIFRLVKFLNQGNEYGTTAALVNTLYKLSASSILPAANNNVDFKSKLVTSLNKTPSSSFDLHSVQTRHALFHNDPQHTAISLKPLQNDRIPTIDTTRTTHIPKAAWTGSIFSKTVSGSPTSYNLFSSKKDNTSSQNENESAVGHMHHGQGQVLGINSAQNPLIQAQKQLLPSSTTALREPQIDPNGAQSPYPLSNSAYSVEGIVVWELPRGKSLCRIFNVARLSDGTLFLPKWMENHKETLVAHCGLKKALYVFEGQSKDRGLRDYSSGKIRFDGTFANRDLFSPHPPRHHMPHFLSDIIPPLVATEVILGSGRQVVPFKCISAEGTGSPSLSTNLIYEVKPFLFLDVETISKPPTSWVPSLAKFFAHPKIGFGLVPDQVSDRGDEPNECNSLTLLRSVMLTNINPYEPYGLFGADGKNHVFTFNGISREPTWTSTGMLRRPCVVSVTVLTRKGHRALLELEELQKVIKTRFVEQGLDLDFKVVDFKDMCFEDQVRIMQETNVLIASHGAGNTNLVFMRPGGTVIEVFPFSYKAGPFDGFAKVFGMEYKTAMSAPQTNVFKACMRRREKSTTIMKEVFDKWDKAVQEDKETPWVHRLDFEKEFGEPGKSEGMTTRICARQQQLKFNVHAVAQMALDSGLGQCHFSQTILDQERSTSSPQTDDGASL